MSVPEWTADELALWTDKVREVRGDEGDEGR